jgi:hypothetical protein
MERPGTAATVPNRVVIGELSPQLHEIVSLTRNRHTVSSSKIWTVHWIGVANLKADLTVFICECVILVFYWVHQQTVQIMKLKF